MYSASHWNCSKGVDDSRLFSGFGAADRVKIHYFLLGLTSRPCMTLLVMPRSSFMQVVICTFVGRKFFTPC